MIRKKIRWKSFFLLFIILISIGGIIYALINVTSWMSDNKRTQEQIDLLQDIIIKEDDGIEENIEIIDNNETIEEMNPYWDYIRMPFINVNFDDLLNTNEDTVGWLKLNGTNINYPFVQTNDNDYYLTHSFNKSYNKAGWVFLDYRNSITNLDKNTILYAHGRLDTTMFGSLKNITSSNWYENSDNYVVRLSTPLQNTLWQVFSVYETKNTTDYLYTEFDSSETFLNFTSMLYNRSIYDFDISINENDKILTLSTCTNSGGRVVLHAKLLKVEYKN